MQSSKLSRKARHCFAGQSKIQNFNSLIGNWKLSPTRHSRFGDGAEIANFPPKFTHFGGAGWSLIELLVVIMVFTILALLATQALILSLRGSKKSESITRVRVNLDYALAVIERNLHNATDIDPCSGATTTSISYTDGQGNLSSFSCEDIGSDGYIASGSARLTSDETNIVACSFVCNPPDVGVPPSVRISVTAEDANVKGAEGARVTSQTEVLLRIY